MRSVAEKHAHRLPDGSSGGRADSPGKRDRAADEHRMEQVTRPEPTADRRPAPERELSREELVAELERVVSRAKTDSHEWQQRAGAVTDDLLPTRRD
jgi:hypothetical protein